MAFQLPAPIDNRALMEELLRKRLELLQQPTPWQTLAPTIGQAVGNITQGVTQGMDRKQTLAKEAAEMKFKQDKETREAYEGTRRLDLMEKSLNQNQTYFDPVTGEQRSFPKGARPLPTPPVDTSMRQPIAKAKVALANANATVSTAVPELDRISELNKNSRGGIIGGAIQKGSSALNIGQNAEAFKNTADVVNSLRSLVAKVLKSTFGGQLSDGERAYLDSVYGASASYTPTEREIAIKNVKQMLTSRASEAEASLSELGGVPSTQPEKVAGKRKYEIIAIE